MIPNNNNSILSFLRKHENEVVLVMINLSNANQINVTVDNASIEGSFENVFSGLSYQFKSKETFELMAYDYMVYKKVIGA